MGRWELSREEEGVEEMRGRVSYRPQLPMRAGRLLQSFDQHSFKPSSLGSATDDIETTKQMMLMVFIDEDKTTRPIPMVKRPIDITDHKS